MVSFIFLKLGFTSQSLKSEFILGTTAQDQLTEKIGSYFS